MAAAADTCRARGLGYRIGQQRRDDDYGAGISSRARPLLRPAAARADAIPTARASDLDRLDAGDLRCLVFTWQVIVVADRWTGRDRHARSPRRRTSRTSRRSPGFVRTATSYRVPTGVFLQSFEFLNANNVEMSGFVWQKYGAGHPPRRHPRHRLAGGSWRRRTRPTEAWRVEHDGGEQIGWYFRGTFRQNFDYSLYPFDRQAVWLRLWHPDPERDVLLVPDLAAYSDTAASRCRHGRAFVYGDWDPLTPGSVTSWSPTTPNFGLGENFGLGGQLNGTPLVNLYFNVGRRARLPRPHAGTPGAGKARSPSSSSSCCC